MSENHFVGIPVGSQEGFAWNRLHEEREEVSEALIRCAAPTAGAQQRVNVLETRLQSLDRALDRLMSGSYGRCSKCSQSIEASTLDVDPTWTLCVHCWSKDAYRSDENGSGEVSLESLDAFDTIILRTINSEYRVFLLDPKAGRALVEGGSQLAHPIEGFLVGSICVGNRMKMWIDDMMLSTSPIQSFQIKQNVLREETVH